MTPDAAILTGRKEEHLVSWDHRIRVHNEAHGPLGALHSLAKERGFDLAVASAFRSFDHQLLIWNAKVSGQRPVLDINEEPLDISALTPSQLMLSILRWSALPGASRHHWGTDLDLWDRAAVPEGYHLKLEVCEYEADGPFYHFAQWLQSDEVASLGFYRPYAIDKGGVAPEPWHLSYRPRSMVYEQQLTPAILAEALANSNILLKNEILKNIEEIFHRFVRLTAET